MMSTGGPAPVQRTLLLLRHAKSDWPAGVPDHERPLAGRGRRDAPAAGRWLRAAGHVPGLVLCSTAERARQTWRLAETGLAAGDPAGDGAAESPGADAGKEVDAGTDAGAGKEADAGKGESGTAESGIGGSGTGESGTAESGTAESGTAGTGPFAPPRVSFEPRVYEASAADLLELVREAPTGVRTLLLVGHEPAISGLALTLAAESHAAPGALERMREKFPTAAIAVLDFTGEWPGLRPGGARLAGFVTPRDIPAGG